MAEKEFYSLPEAAKILGISRIAVFKKVRKGQLEAVRIGRNWAVPSKILPEQAITSEKKTEKETESADNNSLDSMGWD